MIALQLLFFVLWAFEASATREIFICDHGTETRLPSALDSFSAIFHYGGKKFGYDDEMIPSWAKYPIPVANWFADGVYSFPFIDNAALKSSILEVNLLQQDTQWSLISAPFCLLQWKSWCTCANTPVSNLAKLHFEDQLPCVMKLSKNIPEYLVDPSRPSCVQIILSDGAPAVSTNDYAEYNLRVPTADTVVVKELLRRALHNFPIVTDYISVALNHLPLYFLSLAVGLYLTYNAGDIAEEKTFQIALQVFLGLFTALLVLVIVAHRVVNNVLSRHSSSVYMPRIIDSLFGFSMMSIAYQYRYFLMGQAFDMLIKFWDEGAFGYWWLGRVYFAVCIIVSLSVCHIFDLFRDPDSRSFLVGLLACRALGVIFLLNSSSSTPIAYTITGLIALSSPLKNYFHYFYFVLAGYLQPKAGNANVVAASKGVFSSPTSRKLTKSEAEALVKSTTAREMESLRKFLKQNPQELAKFDQTMREDNKESVANLVAQFSADLYSGRPRPPVVAEPVNWFQTILHGIRDIGVLLLLGGIVALFTLNSDAIMSFVGELLKKTSSA